MRDSDQMETFVDSTVSYPTEPLLISIYVSSYLLVSLNELLKALFDIVSKAKLLLFK